MFDSGSIAVPAGKHYTLCNSPKLLDWLFQTLYRYRATGFTFDVETTFPTGKPELGSRTKEKICGISFCWERHYAAYVPLYTNKEGETYFSHHTFAAVVAAIREFLENPDLHKFNQNVKFDASALWWCFGIATKGVFGDPMLAHHLLDENRASCNHSLEAMSQHYLDVSSHKLASEHKKLLLHYDPVLRRHSSVPVELEAIYGCADADASHQLVLDVFEPMLVKEGLDALYYSITMPLSGALTIMESFGFPMDEQLVDAAIAKYRPQVDALRAKANEIVGHPYDLGSTQLLSRYLFKPREKDKAKIEAKRKGKDARGDLFDMPSRWPKFDPVGPLGKNLEYATTEAVLSKFKDQHPLVPVVQEFRKLDKLVGTNMEGFKPHIIDGRVHADFRITGTVTGRLSCGEPNLENVPRKENGGDVIKGFVTAEPGYVIVSCDQSQIELRLLAHHSGDKTMIQSFHAGYDFHSATAKEVFGLSCEVEEVKKLHKDMRDRAKCVNFGIAYGLTAFGLARNLGIENKEAEEIIERYFRRLPKVKQYIDETSDEVARVGFVCNLFKRKRRLPEAQQAIPKKKSRPTNRPDCFGRYGPSYKWQLRHDLQERELTREEIAHKLAAPHVGSEYQRCIGCIALRTCAYDHEYSRITREVAAAKRQAVNAVIQGGAVDITNLALGRIIERIQDEGWDAIPINQIHDDIMFEVAVDQAEAFGDMVQEIMENAVQLTVPLQAPSDIFKCWADKDLPHGQIPGGIGGPVLNAKFRDGAWSEEILQIRQLHRDGKIDPNLVDLEPISIPASEVRPFDYDYAA